MEDLVLWAVAWVPFSPLVPQEDLSVARKEAVPLLFFPSPPMLCDFVLTAFSYC